MSTLRENTSSNIDANNSTELNNVTDKTGASKTVSFASTVSEIDFELTDLTVQDATPMPVTSSTPMRKKEKPAIDINE